MERLLSLFYERFLSGSVIAMLFLTGTLLWLYLRAAPFLPVREKRQKGSLSASIRGLSVALAGTLGIGNIVGVAFALLAGGAGAVFWMWASALVACIVKYGEVVLAFRFRDKTGKGGAMYYMREGLGGTLGKCAGATFAVLCLAAALSMGGLLQSGTVVSALGAAFGGAPLLWGTLLTVLTAAVIFGGVKSISSATMRLVPLMSALYIGMCLVVLAAGRSALPAAFGRIWEEAWSPLSMGGGLGGLMTARAVRAGVSRGLLSNEAGCGTAPLAHVTSGDVHPVRQGRLGMAEVFIDTALLCTLTALAILVTYPTLPGDLGGMELLVSVFAPLFGRGAAGALLAVCIFFFGYATIICWAYYGEACLSFLTGSPRAVLVLRILFCLAVFLGGVAEMEGVWVLTDCLLALQTLLNLPTMLLLSPKLKRKRGIEGEVCPEK